MMKEWSLKVNGTLVSVKAFRNQGYHFVATGAWFFVRMLSVILERI